MFFLADFGVNKFLNGRIIPGIVMLVATFGLAVIGALTGIGILTWLTSIIAIAEFVFDIIKCESDSEGRIDIPKGFFDFL